MSQGLANKLELLRERSEMLAKVRHFFAEKGVLEVDIPILSPFASVDTHIDLIEVTYRGERCFLHSSPEYGMKQLLALGMGDCYQLSHVFRNEEFGDLHNPEFMMAEWYRLDFTFQQMIHETVDFIKLFLDVGTDGKIASYAKLTEGISPEEFACEVQPSLGYNGLTVLVDFPPEEAALAQIKNGMAERFEIIYKGVELANGYHELLDANEQRNRLEKANCERQQLGKPTYPLDEPFLKALKDGVPDCCGVAVGFDRLLMLKNNLDSIHDTVPCSFFI